MSVVSAIIGHVPLDAAPQSPLFGRRADLDRLRRLTGLDTAAEAPAGGLVVVSGDAGIGKTRVLAELMAQARSAGVRVLAGHCLGEAGSSLPYLPFAELLSRLHATDPDRAQDLVATHPQISRLVPGLRGAGGAAGSGTGAVPGTMPGTIPGTVPGGEQPLDRGELLEALHAVLEDLGTHGRLLVVVEDVHWADQSSRDLLTLLFTRGFDAPLSLVASYRSDELHRRHPLRTTLAHWSRLGQVHRVDLAPLPDPDIRDLVRSQRPDDIDEEELQRLVTRAEGNAFFAEELAAASAWGRAGAADLSRLLLVRVEQLDEVGQQVTRIASAGGRHVPHRLLARVAGVTEEELDRGLRSAVEHNVLVPTEQGGYTFRHALLGDSVYEDLLPGERVRAHTAYLSAIAGDPTLGTWADMARHAHAAGDRERALEASLLAADAAMAVGGPDEAFEHFSAALTLLPCGHADTDSVTIRAAAAATAAGRAQRAVDLLTERLERQPVEATPAERAELLGALAATARFIETTIDTVALVEEALALVPAEPPSEQRTRLLSICGQTLADRARYEAADHALAEAIRMADALGLTHLSAEVVTVRARVAEHLGDPEGSLASLQGILADPASMGLAAEMRARHHLGSLLHRSGRLPEALAVYRTGMDRARQVGRRWAPYALDAQVLAGIAAYESGDWDLSLQLLDWSGEPPPQPAASLLAAARFYVAGGRGQAGVLEQLPGIKRWWSSDGMLVIISGSAAIDMHGDAGRLAAAVAEHDAVVERMRELWGSELFRGRVRLGALLVGQLATHAGTRSTEERADLLALGEQVADIGAKALAVSRRDGNDGPETLAWGARLAAESRRLRWQAAGRALSHEELVTAWHEAVEGFRRYGHPFETARSQARLAAALAAGGDLIAARDVAAEAKAVAQRLGAAPLLAELSAPNAPNALAAGRSPVARGVRPGRRDRDGAALTPREREILGLVARGRSNKQIGAQLFISAKTASVHVSNIMAKLGASGRGEAVAVARRTGLLGD